MVDPDDRRTIDTFVDPVLGAGTDTPGVSDIAGLGAGEEDHTTIFSITFDVDFTTATINSMGGPLLESVRGTILRALADPDFNADATRALVRSLTRSTGTDTGEPEPKNAGNTYFPC